MKVFGIGHSRSGTSSLDAALNLLGIKTIHFPSDNETYWELLHQKYDLSILKRCDGLTDSITIPFYKEFDKIYPNSKFILTYRDPDKWFKSLTNKFSPALSSFFKEQEYRLFPWIFKLVFGDYCAWHNDRWYRWDEQGCKAIYKKHLEDVREYFKNRPKDLLVIDVSTGGCWEKLCPFLGVDIPKKDFPWLHKASTQFYSYSVLPPLPIFPQKFKIFI